MNTTRFIFIIVCLLVLTNCNDDLVTIEETTSTPSEIEVEEVPSTGEENYLSLDSDYIFDQSKLPTFELTIEPSDLANINNDPAAEEYVPAALTFEGETISPVGVRYKGSIGAFVGCLSGGGNIFAPSGFKTCTKLSMKVKINWEGRTEKFYGLKKLQFHSMNLDPSQMHDRLGYWMFAQMGVPSPRAIHARLIINGEFAGLFSLVEQIDGRFSRYNFDDGEGNVYKEIWPINDDGNPRQPIEYVNALKTNEDENPSVDIIRGLAVDVSAAETDEELQEAIEEWMDLDKILAYCMVDRTIKHDDGPFHWYCFGGCQPHNFYFVEEPNNKKIHLIPWDLDNAFENITSSNGVTNIPDDWGETRNDCNPFSQGFFGIQQRSAACDKLTRGWTLYEDEYEALRQEFIEGPFSEASIDNLLETWSDQIREATQEAFDSFDDAISIETWEQSMSTLKTQCDIARN